MPPCDPCATVPCSCATSPDRRRPYSRAELGYSWSPLGASRPQQPRDLGEGHVLEPAYQADVVIVGAGVAGLAAAHRLNSAGVTTVVLEAAPYVGGRMATEKVDGFRLDRIGQLLSTSYPELRCTPGLDGLALRPFAPGVLVHATAASTGRAARRRRGRTGRTRRGTRPGEPPSQGPADTGGRRAARVAGRSRRSAAPSTRPGSPRRSAGSRPCPWSGCSPGPSGPRGRALAARGMPARRSRVSAPAAGRAAVRPGADDVQPVRGPRAARLRRAAGCASRRAAPTRCRSCSRQPCRPGTVRTGVRVTSVSTTSVTTAEHGEIRCRAVLVATGARAAAELLPGLRVPPSTR